jgi:LPS export ABC transporter protein LptC
VKRAVFIAAVLLAACNPQPQHAAQQAPTPGASAVPPLQITGRGNGRQPVRVVGRQAGGRKMYELTAGSYVSRSAENVTQATFHDTDVTFYDKDGTTLRAHSPQARVDDRRKQVILSGGVHARTSTGLTLVCDQLVYDEATALLHGTGGVRITGVQGGEQQLLTGNAFTSNVKLTQMTMR